MNDTSQRKLSELETRLGHSFQEPELLRRALTHSSARIAAPKTHDNERLEFLGDRVLGLAVAALLCEQFPDAPEGELARRFNRLVRKETCAEVALEMEIGRYMLMSGGESDSGGRAKTTILGDACEAVLGAVFLDGGYEAARDVIHKFWSEKLSEQDHVPTDAKSALQEWAQGRGMPLPQYVEIDRSGPDHAPQFVAEVLIDGLSPGRGEGPSKRVAEQAAASAVLVREGIWDQAPDA